LAIRKERENGGGGGGGAKKKLVFAYTPAHNIIHLRKNKEKKRIELFSCTPEKSIPAERRWRGEGEGKK